MWRDLLKRRYARSIIIVFISIACNLSLLLAAARAEARPLLRVGIHQFGSDITEDSSGNFHGMETDFMQALGSCATRGTHSNVLQHLSGYLKQHLGSAERAELQHLITQYRGGVIPLVVPLTLLRHHFRRMVGVTPSDYRRRFARSDSAESA